MRYLLSLEEERRLLFQMKAKYGLVPLAPADFDDFPGALEMFGKHSPNARVTNQTYEYIFWASKEGPIRYLSDRIRTKDSVGRAMQKLNVDLGLGAAIDLEATPVVTWTRAFWFDGDHSWIVPSRLGSTRSAFKRLSEGYRGLFTSIEKSLKRNGEMINSWDIPNSNEGMGQKFVRPHNTRHFKVIVWPEAAKMLSQGIKIYHWDA